jgi:hypothetical protein
MKKDDRSDIGENIAAVAIVGMFLGFYGWVISKSLDAVNQPVVEFNWNLSQPQAEIQTSLLLR